MQRLRAHNWRLKMMGRSELLAKLAQEAEAWDSGSGVIAALLREAKAEIEHLAEASQGHFRQAMLNGQAANDLRKDAERYRWLRESKQGCIRLDGSPNTPCDMRWANPQYIHWIDGALDKVIDAAMSSTPAVGAA